MSEMKLAIRGLVRRPSFSLAVVGMLAIGIAGNAAIFSVVNALFLRPLPFPDSERLVELDETAPLWNLRYVGVSVPDADVWRKSNATFDEMAFFTDAGYNLSADGMPAEHVQGAKVTYAMLRTLGLKPLFGRDFEAADDRPGAAGVALVGFDTWQRSFQADPNIVGHPVKLDQQPFTIIGVLPRDAVFPDRAALWTPLAADPTRPSGYFLNGIGRLRPGVSVGRARADLLRAHQAMIADGHAANRMTSPVLMPLRDRYLGDVRAVSRVLAGALGLVLLLACVNIAALMMVRAAARSEEMAIRAALGASPGRIAVQLLCEGVVLASAGAAVGVPLGLAALHAIVARLPESLPQWIRFSVDARFAIFCVAITGGAALLFSLVPLAQASRPDVRASLQSASARTATTTRRQRAMSGVLVVCETGLALMLLVSAGLLVRAFQNVVRVDPGFRPGHVLAFEISLPDATYDTAEKKIAYYEALLPRLRSLPGVLAAGATSSPPLGGHWGAQFEAEGGTIDGRLDHPVVQRIAATPGYFDAIGATLLHGRTFDPQDDRPGAHLVVLVNESFARLFWRAGDAVGKRIRYPGGKEWYEIVGLLRDEKHDGLDRDAAPTVFLPYSTAVIKADRNDFRSLQLITFVLRSGVDPTSLAASARDIVRRLDPDVPMYGTEAMTERIHRSLWIRRAYSVLFGGFALVAILLAAAGVYAIVSFAVTQRAHEIGIRLALGARPAQVLAYTMAGGMWLVAAGVAGGLVGALWASRMLRSLLVGVSPRDPWIYAAAAGCVLAVGVLANFVPARRAASVDPMRTLHGA